MSWCLRPFLISNNMYGDRQIISGVYIIENSYNGNLYVGSSKNINQRFRGHVNALRAGNHRNKHLQNAFFLYGEAAFLFVIVEITSDVLMREQFFIDLLVPAYNIHTKAASPAGRTHSPESRKNMSEAHKGKKRKPLTPEHRLALSIARSKVPCPPHEIERLKKLAQSRKGKLCKPFSEEHCRKISAAKIKRPVERTAATGEIQLYPSISATKNDGFRPQAVWSCCKGRYRSHKGYQWRYAR